MSNNVTPKAGQVWESPLYAKVIAKVVSFYNNPEGDKIIEWDAWMNCSVEWCINNCTFIPQSDLEWLAVKVESLGSNIKFIARRGSEYLIFETKPEHTPGLYTRQQHQNMRYELGLDENKREELTNGMIFYHLAPISEDFKKEIDVIDMRNAKLEDKFNYVYKVNGSDPKYGPLGEKQVMEVVSVSLREIVTENELGLHHIFNVGADTSIGGNYQIVSEYQAHKGLKVFDIVEVVTNSRQEEDTFATILELTDFEGEDAALIQYHHNTCGPQRVCVCYMEKYDKEIK